MSTTVALSIGMNVYITTSMTVSLAVAIDTTVSMDIVIFIAIHVSEVGVLKAEVLNVWLLNLDIGIDPVKLWVYLGLLVLVLKTGVEPKMIDRRMPVTEVSYCEFLLGCCCFHINLFAVCLFLMRMGKVYISCSSERS